MVGPRSKAGDNHHKDQMAIQLIGDGVQLQICPPPTSSRGQVEHLLPFALYFIILVLFREHCSNPESLFATMHPISVTEEYDHRQLRRTGQVSPCV